MRHGKRVVAYSAMRQQGADVVHKRKMARLPQAPAKHNGGENADNGKDSLHAGQPGGGKQRFAALRSALGSALLLDAGHHGGDENQQRRPHREGVVLMIG